MTMTVTSAFVGAPLHPAAAATTVGRQPAAGVCARRPAVRMVAAASPASPSSPPATETSPQAYGRTEAHFGRIVTAMITPFKTARGGAEVDYAVAEQLAAYLAGHGSDALVVGGTTGESPTLKWSEQYELFNVVRQTVGHKVRLIAGAGSNSTDEAIEATRRAKKLNYDGTLQVVPYYNKPPQEGLYQHFKSIAAAEPDLPVMLYNIPGRSGINMSAEVTSRLARLDNVVATKEASGDLDQFTDIRRNTDADFHMYSGDDALTLPLMSLGATGVVSVASHFIGPELQRMVKLYLDGHVADATALHLRYSRLFADLFCMANPIPTKAGLRLQGWAVGPPRLPLTDATPEVEAKIAALFRDLGLA
ncbi:hypothetical protein BU14_0614s0001 [Porphyra umbilicalis]|uniref:4-hydroxy-tetrahydrodipicolinate synthase n=1 Tax=Porphyra umbilicalis TaxID=2786 RepID=A0A1X6NR98_PORUM|nr:hypothetical protein BU14_0614s0001 [Porphyra umbilicalis]|eukprot:OSX71026.1 hypothetical protein BU14_0614s0001 [Porphyra umbilicalis]